MNYTTKVTVRHWRISDSLWWNSYRKVCKGKGKPHENWLIPTSKKVGFLSKLFAPKGGKTEVTIQVFDGDDPIAKFVGVALCSMSDNFSYKEGRDKALDRAKDDFHVWVDKLFGL